MLPPLSVCLSVCQSEYIYVLCTYNMCVFCYIYIFFIKQRVKVRAIPCPHQPPTSFFYHWTGYLKELYIYIYIYIIKSRDYIGRLSSFLMCSLWFLKNAFTFGRWCYYAFTVTVSWYYVITQEWWFRVYFIHAENFLHSTKSNLMHIAPWSEDDLRQLSNGGQWFLFLIETKWLSVLENHDNQLQ